MRSSKGPPFTCYHLFLTLALSLLTDIGIVLPDAATRLLCPVRVVVVVQEREGVLLPWPGPGELWQAARKEALTLNNDRCTTGQAILEFMFGHISLLRFQIGFEHQFKERTAAPATSGNTQVVKSGSTIAFCLDSVALSSVVRISAPGSALGRRECALKWTDGRREEERQTHGRTCQPLLVALFCAP